MMRFNYAVLMLGEELIACKASSKGWKIINPRSLPSDRSRSVCVFAGGSEIMGRRLALPAARESEIRRAAPFAVEDDIAAEISDTHFAIGPKRTQSTERDIRIVSKDIMQCMIDELKSYGVKNAPIYSVADALPDNTLLEAGTQIYGRINNRTFGLDADLPADFFVAISQDAEELQVFGAQLASKLGISAVGDGAATSEELLLMIAEMQLADAPVNLRQGSYSVKRTVSKQQLLDWRRTAALVAIAGALLFANLLTGTWALNARTNSVQVAMNNILATEFPEADGNYNRVLDLYRDGGAPGAQPLPSVVDVTALLYKAVGEVDAAQIRSLRYDAERREAICVVSAQDFAALETLSESLRRGGLTVSGGDARQDRNGVVGEFKLGAS